VPPARRLSWGVDSRASAGGGHTAYDHFSCSFDQRLDMGSVIKKRRKRMAKKKHRKLLRKTRHQRRNKK